MPTVVIKPGATIFVTGVNGLIGSNVVDQLLARGYNVRGAVRDVEKVKWLKEYFDGKYNDVCLELVEVPDMTADGCYDHLLENIDGFIHLAAPVGTINDLDLALETGRRAGISALEACAKTPSIKSFVNTSSSVAASFALPQLEQELHIDDKTYNDHTVSVARAAEGPRNNFPIYCAMKTETERAMWQWVQEKKPGFRMNSILPNANFGPVLVPEHQGYPSTIDWARRAWTGEHLEAYAAGVPPQYFTAVRDAALVHIAALIYEDVKSERLFVYAERFNFNDLLAIYRKNYPDKTFKDDIPGLGRDMVVPPTARAEEVLKWIKGSGWDSLEESIVAMSKDW
ncbi:hypothetical protein DE146DRAFT_693473 [Phaeosphaeria sp. MPI-PUGE-AT-0046c]|nr:hypothetical protein DE146DRAFT_693473 [Phaeosphaeria sp. MPI-PUGE-AT-0046c]